MTNRRTPTYPISFLLLMITAALCAPSGGCRQLVRNTDRDVATLIQQRQREALGHRQWASLGNAEQPPDRPDRAAYDRNPSPTTTEVPEGFESTEEPSQPDAFPTTAPQTGDVPEQQPSRFRETVFTLTDALAYAQRHRREYQTAKEDLYLAALALTLEHHLWTPQFAASLRGVYGNFGEVTDFDQATRFVADLSVAQRLPYGGEFTAAAVSTLIRDVKRNITASEGSSIALGLDIPFLRGAGHVAQENLVQLERSLTYAVRRFERFRRQQLVDVTQRYLNLLRVKQSVTDAITSLRSAENLHERALEYQKRGMADVLDTGRAEEQMLSERNRVASQREAFRAAADQFKIAIGMLVAEPVGLDDLETIESIEQQVEEGKYPLLRVSSAAQEAEHAVSVATQYRLDVLTRRDQIDDAKRGVAIAKNALLPDLDWTSSLTFDTDPEHYKLGAFEHARATWRTEVMLSMNDRFRERNAYRSSLIDVRRAQRSHTDQLERVRADVLSAINQIRLQGLTLGIQQRRLDVAENNRAHAEYLFEKGRASNREYVEAQNEYIGAQNSLNSAKTSRWTALLNFRLATGTLRVDEDGVQHDDPALE
jgi:outer membrane protein TolC